MKVLKMGDGVLIASRAFEASLTDLTLRWFGCLQLSAHFLWSWNLWTCYATGFQASEHDM